MTIKSLVVKSISRVIDFAFLVFSVLIYLAYYQGLTLMFGSYVDHWLIGMALVATYLFRLDVIAGSFAFYGMWQAWHWQLWGSMSVGAVFIVVSIIMNHGETTRFKDFIGRVTKPEQPIDAVAIKKDKTT